MELEIAVAGQRFTQSFAPSANLHYTFTWDGRDAYGRLLQGVQPVTVRVGYVYTGQYYEPGVRNPAFASPPEGVVLATDRERLEITLWQTSNGTIGLFDWLPQGLGGWSLSDHHVYDPNRGIIYLGDGTTRSVAALNTRATLLVPGSNEGVAGGAANPAGLLIRPDGGLLIAYEHTIVLVRTDGTSEVIAGTGETGDGGDGGPATEAQLTDAVALALGPDGSLYIADRGAHRVRRVAPDGTIGAVRRDGGVRVQRRRWPGDPGDVLRRARRGRRAGWQRLHRRYGRQRHRPGAAGRHRWAGGDRRRGWRGRCRRGCNQRDPERPGGDCARH
ncbi:MAG: hypothetical protein U0841_02680 [Chloroflexia bacterium]